ncbi:MAG: DUF5684 domain-containing protein [Verrucomicrobiales bacterium]
MYNFFLAQNEFPAGEMNDAAAAAAAGAAVVVNLISLVVGVIVIIAMWKVFSKAGKPGWAAIVPIYNVIVLLEVIGRPVWWVVLFFIPFVNIVIAFITSIDLAKSFGKGAGFGIGLIFLSVIFYPILGFGSAQYKGPAAAEGAAA